MNLNIQLSTVATLSAIALFASFGAGLAIGKSQTPQSSETKTCTLFIDPALPNHGSSPQKAMM